MWKAVLIDDEEIALDVLEIILRDIGGVKVVGRFQFMADALGQCERLEPDLIFLDIEMPRMSGLEAAEQLKLRCPDAEIVFVTAHDQYAVDAFHTEAIGYLLKPVAKPKLLQTLSRYSNLQRKMRGWSDGDTDSRARKIETNSAGSAPDTSKKQTLTLKMMGSMELYDPSGNLLKWRTKKTKELFAFLWHYRGSPVYKYTILERLWPDLSAKQAQQLLHTTLYYMRSLFKSLGYDEIVKYGDERYSIDTRVLHSDLEELLELMKMEATEKTVMQAVAYYSGDYLETEHYDWANSYRIELRSAVLSFLAGALGLLSNTSKITLLNKLIELDPFCEDYYDMLVSGLSQAGDQMGAAKIERLKKQIWSEEI